MPENISDILGKFLPWLISGGLSINTIWGYFTTKKERKLNQDKDSTAVTKSDLENAMALFEFQKTINAEQAEAIKSLHSRIKTLEGINREIADETTKTTSYFKDQIKMIEEANRRELQKIESFYREKCRECNQDQKA